MRGLPDRSAIFIVITESDAVREEVTVFSSTSDSNDLVD